MRNRLRAGAAVGLLLAVLLPGLAARADSVINSVHNLSAAGPGTIKANAVTNACIFCHVVHHASGVTPLWNHSMSSVSNYVVYSSDRLTSLGLTIPQPNGASRLCLSCHDGTVALGSVSSGAPQITMQNGTTVLPSTDPDYLGTDLSKDHPISFVYNKALANNDPEVNDPSQLTTKAVRMDSQNRLQCTACHDPHNDQYGDFLVMDNTASALCIVCHNEPLWTTSAHGISPMPVPQALINKIPVNAKMKLAKARAKTVGAMACDSCHMSHKAGSKAHMLEAAVPEENCFVCHNGAASRKNVEADFQKPSIHPITLNSLSHSPVEDPINPPTRHVVCADCHNSHAANASTAVAPRASGALANLTGVSAAGGVVKPLLQQYELCFRCHADSTGRGPATVTRQFSQTNLRLAFSVANQSFHPVESVGKNQNSVPSLITPWTVNSVMYCTDCHNSDSGPGGGGSGANGPHGSVFSPILERNLSIVDYETESASAYALCYKCHDRNVVLGNKLHQEHVVNDKTASTTCHDSHGVGTVPHLINFNTTYATNGSLGVIKYLSTGTQHGVCSLSCHGTDHKNAAY